MRTLAFALWKKLFHFLLRRGFNLLFPYDSRHAGFFRPLMRRLRPPAVQGNGMTIFLDPDDELHLSLNNGVYEPETAVFLSRFVQPGDTVFDIGANIGYFSLLLSRLAGPAGRLFAFEPAPGNYALLTKNLAANHCDNARAIAAAVADVTGTARLAPSRQMVDYRLALTPDTAGTSVLCFALDDFIREEHIDRVDLIKMDIQGAEGLALAGMRQLLSRHGRQPVVLFEFWPVVLQQTGITAHEILVRLQAEAYDLFELAGSHGSLLPIIELASFVRRCLEVFSYTLIVAIPREHARRSLLPASQPVGSLVRSTGRRVLLANAPWQSEGHYGVRAGSRWPHFERCDSNYMPFPFFLAYAAALLEQDGHTVAVIDGIADHLTPAAFYDRAAAALPELVVLEIATASLASDLADFRELRRRLPQTTLIAVGNHAPLSDPAFLAAHPAIDIALHGEYEITLRDLLRAHVADRPLDIVPGLVYRQAGGTPACSSPRLPLADLDALPWPARHLFPMTRYYDVPGDMPLPSVQMWGSRGCPYQCSFCAWPQVMYGSARYRPRAAAAIADEFEHLVRHGGYASVYFDDDTFNIGRERLLAFAAELQRRNLRVPWAMMARADLMDRELLAALRASGLHAVKYGIESADQDIVNGIGKKLDLRLATANIRLTRKLGIKTHLTFCFGLPGETRATAEATIRLALKLAPDTLQFSLATPFPGSRLYEQGKREGLLISEDYNRYDGYRTAVLRTQELTATDLETIRARAQQRWDAFVLRRRIIRQPLRYATDALLHPATLAVKLRRVIP